MLGAESTFGALVLIRYWARSPAEGVSDWSHPPLSYYDLLNLLFPASLSGVPRSPEHCR